MALEIRSIPVLTGETAERFVREAEENERNPQRKALRMSFADVEKILVRSTANFESAWRKKSFCKVIALFIELRQKMSLILSVVAMKTLMISFIKRLVSMMGISPLQRKVLTH